jgi:transposase
LGITENLLCGVSKVSEMDANAKAVAMLKRLDISLRSLRLDKYFNCRKIIQQFNKSVSLFILPKKNLRRIKM